jgi:hypothetical protein
MSSTIRVEESGQIARPPVEVWNAIADYAFDFEWRKGLREMTPNPPGPPAPGTRVHEVVRNSGRDYVADTVVTELDQGTSYRFAGSGTIGASSGDERYKPPSPGRVPCSPMRSSCSRRAPCAFSVHFWVRWSGRG